MTGQAVAVVLAGLVVLGVGYRLLSSPGACQRCGWSRGSAACRMAHYRGPVEAERMWTRPQWERYRRTGRLPRWDHSRRGGG
jgi:hypothetical protein